jgi:acetoin utilization protein AcuB
MRVFEIMSEKVETIGASDPAELAWDQMQRSLTHHLVVTEGSLVVGVLSDRDLGGPHGEAVRQDRLVGDLMTRKIVTSTPDTTVREAANLLRGHVIGCLPVLQGERLVGIVTRTDLLDLIGRGIERPVRAPRRSTMRPKREKSA